MLTVDRVNELLTYCPASGEFRWRVTRGGTRVGQLAGTLNVKGYRLIEIDGRRYPAHRVAWFVTKGEWPTEQIDHKNGVRDDNRIDNLRPATHTENCRNRARMGHNTSGHPGVSFHIREQKWQAYIYVDGKRIPLGYFTTLAEAVVARQAAEILHFGEFRRAA